MKWTGLIDGKMVATCVGTVVAIVWLWSLPPQIAKDLIEEGGPFELPTVIAFFAGTGLCLSLLCRRPGERLAWLCGGLVTMALALRELDFHKAFTPRAISSTRFYFHPDISWQMKATVVLCLIPPLAATGYLVWRARRAWPAAVAERQAWVGHAVLAVGTLVLSRCAEKLHFQAAYVVEEVCELTFAILLIWLIIELGRRPRATRA